MAKTSIGGWIALSLAFASASVLAQGAGPEALEREFWRCDHAATQGMLDGGAAMQCSVATEAFKQRRFGGDFGAMLAWWRANKDVQHLALSRASSPRLTRAD